MRKMALYYPYTHVRDDNWLKAAALYWPRLVRLTPAGYPRHDSGVARALGDELDFLVNIDPPAKQITETCDQFLDFARTHQKELRQRYRPSAAGEPSSAWREVWQEIVNTNVNWRTHNGGWIHLDETTAEFREELTSLGLGTVDRRGDGLFLVHPALSAAYAMMLAGRIAEANDLALVTDQAALHQINTPGAEAELVSTLLDDEPVVPARTADDVGVRYAEIAISTVVPSNLDDVPVAKVVKARQKLAAEFDVFRQHLESLDQQFAELAEIESAPVLQARLQLLVDRDLRKPADTLRRDLHTLGMEPANAVLGMKTLQLPAAAATAAAGVPLAVGEAGMVTARLVAAGLQTRAKQQAARRGGPAGYLLGLKQNLRRRGLFGRASKPAS